MGHLLRTPGFFEVEEVDGDPGSGEFVIPVSTVSDPLGRRDTLRVSLFGSPGGVPPVEQRFDLGHGATGSQFQVV